MNKENYKLSSYQSKFVRIHQENLDHDFQYSKKLAMVYEINQSNLKLCAKLIKEGQIVAFQTETVYKLGFNIYSNSAYNKSLWINTNLSKNDNLRLNVFVNHIRQILQFIDKDKYD